MRWRSRKVSIAYSSTQVVVKKKLTITKLSRNDGTVRPLHRKLRPGTYSVNIEARRDRDVFRRTRA